MLDHQHPDQQNDRQQIVQACEKRSFERRQLDDFGVGIVDDQIRLRSRDAQQRDIDCDHHREHDPDRASRKPFLEPAERVVDDVGKDDQRAKRHEYSRQTPERRCPRARRKSLDSGLTRFEMNDVEESDVRDGGG